MNPNHSTLILFDIGGVLLELDYGQFYERAAKLSSHLTAEDFKKRYIESGLEGSFLKGQLTINHYLNRIQKEIYHEKIDKEKIIEANNRCWKHPINEVINLKKRLHETGYSIGLFSNIQPFAFEFISENYHEILEVYDSSNPAIYSNRIGSIKPEPEMYEKIKGYNKVILIEDKESYLRTGIEQFGWYGILFTPYIDKAEAIRAVHNNTEKPSKNFRVANSVEDLITSLSEFGVKL